MVAKVQRVSKWQGTFSFPSVFDSTLVKSLVTNAREFVTLCCTSKWKRNFNVACAQPRLCTKTRCEAEVAAFLDNEPLALFTIASCQIFRAHKAFILDFFAILFAAKICPLPDYPDASGFCRSVSVSRIVNRAGRHLLATVNSHGTLTNFE